MLRSTAEDCCQRSLIGSTETHTETHTETNTETQTAMQPASRTLTVAQRLRLQVIAEQCPRKES